MIRAQRQLFYFVGEKPYASLRDAQIEDLCALMPETVEEPSRVVIAQWMLDNAKAVVDTLTTTPRSRLRARKMHGANRKKPGTKPAEPVKA